MTTKAENDPVQTQADKPLPWDGLFDYSEYRVSRCYRKVVRYRAVEDKEAFEKEYLGDCEVNKI